MISQSDENLKALLEEMIDFSLTDSLKIQEDSLKILKKIFMKPDLINIFKLNSEQDSEDIEFAILKAFLACKKTKIKIEILNLQSFL